MIHRLQGRNALCIHAKGVARVHVTIDPGEITARDVQPDAVSTTKEDTRGRHVNLVLINLPGCDRFRPEDGPAVLGPNASLGHVISRTIRVDVYELGRKIRVSGRGRCKKVKGEGTRDLDSSAASTEYADFSKFAVENWHRMTPDARAKFRVYQQLAQSAQARGLTGIPQNEYEQMKWQMRGTGYLDASAGQAIEQLHAYPGMTDANRLIGAISRGTADRDGQAAGREYADFCNFAMQNWNRLTPDARGAFGAYTGHVQQAWLTGQTGIRNFGGMLSDMRASADLMLMRQGFFRI